MSIASAERITEVLNEETAIKNPEHPVMEVPDGSIDFDHVSFSYEKGAEEFVLQDIDLHIRSGETIGIIGGTGSAKSTLVNLISRLYDVTEGEVKVGGRDVREYDLETLRNQVSVVLQNNVLFSGSILENLRWAMRRQPERNVRRPAGLHVRMSSSSSCRKNTIRISSGAEPMCRAARSRGFVSPER